MDLLKDKGETDQESTGETEKGKRRPPFFSHSPHCLPLLSPVITHYLLCHKGLGPFHPGYVSDGFILHSKMNGVEGIRDEEEHKIDSLVKES